MITIELLKNHSHHIPALATIWYEVLGKPWIPGATIEKAIQCYEEHLNDNHMPITFVALDNNKPVGMCSLRENDGIRDDLTPWLGSLVITPSHQKKGIGPQLINATKQKAIDLHFETLYLFTLDPTIPEYYIRLGWHVMGADEFKGHNVSVMGTSLG
jgi:predicted N-acetyltransferase YhbS